jgi:hypothetical protein
MEDVVAVGVLNLASFLIHAVVIVLVVRRIAQVIETSFLFPTRSSNVSVRLTLSSSSLSSTALASAGDAVMLIVLPPQQRMQVGVCGERCDQEGYNPCC